MRFETACTAFEEAPEEATRIGKALQVLAKKAGIYGMIGGQVVDVSASGKNITEDILSFYLLSWRQEALFRKVPMMIGAILAGAEEEEVAVIEQVAKKIGIAFQIQDDIFRCHQWYGRHWEKPIGKRWEKNHKTTLCDNPGLEQAQKDVEEISQRALDGLASLKEKNGYLDELVAYLIHRKK